MAPGVRAGLLIALATAAAGQETPPPPSDVVDALIEHHHGVLRGTFETALLTLTTPDGGATMRAVMALPDRLRVDRPDDTIDVLRDDVAWRCAAGRAPERLEGDELDAVLTLRDSLRAVVLAPLWQRTGVERAADGTLRLTQPNGETWTLGLDDDGTEVRSLSGPRGTVEFRSFLRTGVTVLPQRVVLPQLGERVLRFEASDLYLDPAVFEDPFAIRVDPTQKLSTRPLRATTAADLPTKPEVQDIDARTYLVLEDPQAWPKRVETLLRVGSRLAEQGQMPDGMPTYVIGEKSTELLVPFRPDPGSGRPPFSRRADQRVRHEPTHRAVVFAPEPGPWDQVRERGNQRMTRFCDEHELVAAGPLRMIPMLDPTTPPTASEQRVLRVRLELPVKPR